MSGRNIILKVKWFSGILAGIILGSAWISWGTGCTTARTDSRNSNASVGERETDLELALPLEVQWLFRETLCVRPRKVSVRAWFLLGEVSTFARIPVESRVAGKIRRIHVREGASVRAGEILVELDPKDWQERLEQIRVQQELACTLAQRYERLYRARALAELQYLEAQVQCQRLTRQYQEIRHQVQELTLRAPVSGYVERIQIREGEVLMPGMPALWIVSSATREHVDVQVPGRYAGELQPGMVATLQPILRGENCIDTGKISFVSSVIDPRSRMFRVQIERQSSHCPWKSGMGVRIRVFHPEQVWGVWIPRSYLVRDPDKGALAGIWVDSPGEHHPNYRIVQVQELWQEKQGVYVEVPREDSARILCFVPGEFVW